MDIRPILTSLLKHRIPALLIVLEVALACAVLSNAVFLVAGYVEQMRAPNAIDEDSLSVIQIDGIDARHVADSLARDLAALRGIPGVESAAAISGTPLSGNAATDGFTATEQGQTTTNTAVYFLGEDADKALGLKLLRGRFFTPEEYAAGEVRESGLPTSPVAIVNQSDAQRLWPGQDALGKTLYSSAGHWTVIGVVADVMPQDPKWNGPGGAYSSAFFPTRINGMFDQLVIRSAKADRSRVLRDALDRLEKLEPDAVIEGKLYTDIRQHYYADITNTGWMLLLVCVVMLAVTAFGIIGLTSFWVSQRRKQIGVRRAIGARRDQILRYFQTENFLLSAAGVGLGAILTFAINLYLIAHYQAQRMPWYYLPSSALALWALGQLAVLGPALRAASVPPVEATRTV